MTSDEEAFCEEVRCDAGRIAALIGAGRTADAGKMALALTTKAATRKEQAKMQQEVSTPDRYNLAQLPQEGGE